MKHCKLVIPILYTIRWASNEKTLVKQSYRAGPDRISRRVALQLHWLMQWSIQLVDAMVDETIDAMVDTMLDAMADAMVDETIDVMVYTMVDTMIDAMVGAMHDVMVGTMVDAMVEKPPPPVTKCLGLRGPNPLHRCKRFARTPFLVRCSVYLVV